MNAAFLADQLTLGALLDALKKVGAYELLAHRKQGEFHHDVVVRTEGPLAAPYVVVSTNCNGGVKEVLLVRNEPSHDALWHMRCPENPEFRSEPMPEVVDQARTVHYFDPCELLGVDARSELLPEHRRRQRGGGWEPR